MTGKAAYYCLTHLGVKWARLAASRWSVHSAGVGLVKAAITMALLCITFGHASAQAGFTQSAPKWSTTNFLGTDAGIRAQNCFNFLANMNAAGLNFGGTCTLEYETNIDMSVNPFAGATSPNATAYTPMRSELILSQTVPNTTEVPIVVANGTTYNTNIPGMAELAGPGVGVGGNQNGSGGATLVAGASYPPAGSTTSPCATRTETYCTNLGVDSTVSAKVDDGNQEPKGGASGCGFPWANPPSTPATYRVCVTGTNISSLLKVDGWLAIPYNYPSTGGQIWGHIESFFDANHATLTQQMSSVASAGLTNSSFSVTYPMVQMGVKGLPNTVNQGITVHDFSINANQVPGSIALANYDSPEMNLAYNLHLTGYNDIGFDMEGPSPQTSRFHDIMFTPDYNTCTQYTTDLMVNGAAPQGGEGLVLANGLGCGSTNSVGIVLNAVNISLHNIHTEQKTPALAINHQVPCTTVVSPCPGILLIPTSSAPHNIVVDRMDSDCASGSGGCLDTVLIDTFVTSANPYDIDIRSVTAGSVAITNTLRDLVNNNTLTESIEPSFSYRLDASASGVPIMVVTTCAPPVGMGTVITNGWCYSGGTQSFYAGSSTSAYQVNPNPVTATTPTVSITPTWSTTGNVDAALLVNPTNTASGSGSLLADFQLGGTSMWKADEGGTVTQAGGLTLSGTTTAATTISTTSSTENLTLQPDADNAVNVTNTLSMGQTAPTLTITPSWSGTSAAVDAALLINPGSGGATNSLLIDAKDNGTSKWDVDAGGNVTQTGGLTASGVVQAAGFAPTTNVLISNTSPTISSGFCSTGPPTIATQNGPAAFTINIGTCTNAMSGTVGLPTAAHGWNCFAFDESHPTTGGGFYVKQTAETTGPNTVTLTGYSSAGVAADWSFGDILSVSCFAR